MSHSMQAALLNGAKNIRIHAHPRPELKPGMVLLKVRRVGICGSDLHYFEHGYCAAFVPDRPFVLGHEFTAEVAEISEGVEQVQVGQRVTANPARSCGFCDECKGGRPNLCRKVIMLGSASTKPPTDGALAEFVTVRADQCHVLPAGMDDGLGAMMEPFAVGLHAVKRAGSVSGKRVLILGGGTIGLLTALAARCFGAAPVAVGDIVPERRKLATQFGADWAIDPTEKGFAESAREATQGGFDVIFEASGARPALRQAFDLIRPGGTLVQIGTVGTEDVPLPANLVMNREINFIGSMRYGNVFGEAIRLVETGRVNLQPLLSGVLPFSQTAKAMELASDKSQALKIQVTL